MAHASHKTRETASKKVIQTQKTKKEKKYLGIPYVTTITSVPCGQRSSIWSPQNISQSSERHRNNMSLQPEHQRNMDQLHLPLQEHSRVLQPLWLGKAPSTHSAQMQGFCLTKRTNQDVYMMPGLPSVQEGSGMPCFKASHILQCWQLRVAVLQRLPRGRDPPSLTDFHHLPHLIPLKLHSQSYSEMLP